MDDGGLVSTTSPDEYWISVQIAPEFEAAMDMEHLHAIAVHTLLAEGHREPLELGITITTDQEIHTLNKQYLDHDYPTDVLSFGSGTALLERNPGGVDTEPDEREPVRADEYVTEGYEGEEPDGANQPERPIRDAESAGPGSETGAVAFVTPPGWPRYLGDVVISYETAAVQAADYDHSPADEVDVLLVHGILHLLGYDDQAPAEREHMHARQDAVLAGFRG